MRDDINYCIIIKTCDNTVIEIIPQNEPSYQKTLPSFGTYTDKTGEPLKYLASGTEIKASAPITVISGNLCPHSSLGAYISTVPDVTQLGKEYLVPHVISES